MKYYRIDIKPPVRNNFAFIDKYFQTYNNLLVNFENTKGLTINDIYDLKNRYKDRVSIRIAGGYTDDKIASDQREYLKYDNIYTADELVSILREIQNIESGLRGSYTPEQKLFYFIGYLKNKIIYHPDFEHQPSKNIRSLTGLLSGKTVCAGYALILKELCDRNGVECDYVSGWTGKDPKTGKYTGAHAWNLVHLNGKIIPIDLTWNAGRNEMGQLLDIQDIANVNAFIKTHTPMPYEKIQDYDKNLYSLDGRFIRATYNMVNKSMSNNVTREPFVRSDGSKFLITLVEQGIHDNIPCYKYVFNAVRKDGTLDCPLVIRSTSNVLSMHALVKQRRKCEKELVKAQGKNDTQRVQELTKYLNETAYFNSFHNYIADVLFSKENLKAAVIRGDMFIGGIEATRDSKGKATGIKGVVVDPKLGSELKAISQKNVKRSDDTFLAIEKMNPIQDQNGRLCFRYCVYETLGANVVKKNTIITDEDIFLDNRQALYDDFLSRSRLDRKEKSSSGYLGRFDKSGMHIYDAQREEYFTHGMYQRFSLQDSHIKMHNPDITFNDMKRLLTNFKYSGTLVVNRYTNRELQDERMKKHYEFANLWCYAAGMKMMQNDIVPGFNYAFSAESEKIFDIVNHQIENSINKVGYIDPVDILVNIKNESNYKYVASIIIRLFANQRSCDLIEEVYRMQNPGALNQNKKIKPLVEESKALELVAQKLSDKEKEERDKIDVVYQNGNVVLKGRR